MLQTPPIRPIHSAISSSLDRPPSAAPRRQSQFTTANLCQSTWLMKICGPTLSSDVLTGGDSGVCRHVLAASGYFRDLDRNKLVAFIMGG